MSKLSRLMTMAAIAAAASQPGMTDLPVINHRPLPKYKGESPKCKTCVHFSKYGPYRCSQPMKMACDRYERNKKKK